MGTNIKGVLAVSIEEIRTTMLEALEDADALDHLDTGLLEGFVQQQNDISLKQLDLDSLARMELLIVIETDYNLVVSPEELASFETLGQIAQHVQSCTSIDRPVNVEVPEEAILVAQEVTEQPPVVKLFKRVFRICKTVAQLNKALETFEHRLSPKEFATLSEWQRMGKLLPAEAESKYQLALDGWLRRIGVMLEAAGKPEAEAYVTQRVSPFAYHYVGPGQRSNKTLLICFTGKNSRRLMIPNIALLQHCDAHQYDLMVISDPWGNGFRAGIPLLDGKVTDVVDWLTKLKWIDEYHAVRTVGCSAGVYPALLTGFKLRSELVVSIGGRFGPLWSDVLGMTLRIAVTALLGRCENLILSYSKGKDRDRYFATLIALLTGGVRVAINTPGYKLGHRILERMLENGDLQEYLEDTVFSSKESDFLSGKGYKRKKSYPSV